MGCRQRKPAEGHWAGGFKAEPDAAAPQYAVGKDRIPGRRSCSPEQDLAKVVGKRRRKAVNYAQLAAEMFGEGREGEAAEDDDWSPRAAGMQADPEDD